MRRHLLIATVVIGGFMLLGSGVMILQLWTRSSQAENRIAALQRESQSAKQLSQQRTTELQDAEFQLVQLTEEQGRARRFQGEQTEQIEDLRRRLTESEAQNEELKKVARTAVALSDQVVALREQLAAAKVASTRSSAAPANASGPMGTGSRSKLVAVAERRTSVQRPVEDEKPAYDDSGWTSAATAQPPESARPALQSSGVTHPLGLPNQSVIILQP